MSTDAVTGPPLRKSGMMEDIFLWRRRKLSFSVLFVSTATWVLLNVYGFNSITLVSWTTMAVVSLLFLWGNLLRLLSKEEPELSRLEVSEEFVEETARACRELGEEAIRWMFHVSCEREWFVFARTVLGVWVLSRIGNLLDLQTCLFIGSVVGLTAPVLWEKQKGRIRKVGDKFKEKSMRAYDIAHQKIVPRQSKEPDPTVAKETKTE